MMNPTAAQALQLDDLFLMSRALRHMPRSVAQNALFDLATDHLQPKELHTLANRIDRAADEMERNAQ